MSSRRATALAAVLLVRCGALLDLPDEPELAAKPHARGRHPDDAKSPGRSAPVSSAGDVTTLVPPASLGASVDSGATTADAGVEAGGFYYSR